MGLFLIFEHLRFRGTPRKGRGGMREEVGGMGVVTEVFNLREWILYLLLEKMEPLFGCFCTSLSDHDGSVYRVDP